MRDYSAKDVEAYIAGAGREARPKLEEIRKIVRAAVPQADESISWGVPFYKYHGLLAGFAAFKDHISFGLAFVIDSDKREMLENKGYKTGKKTIQIRFDQKTPTAVIRHILKAKAKANEAKRKAK